MGSDTAQRRGSLATGAGKIVCYWGAVSATKSLHPSFKYLHHSFGGLWSGLHCCKNWLYYKILHYLCEKWTVVNLKWANLAFAPLSNYNKFLCCRLEWESSVRRGVTVLRRLEEERLGQLGTVASLFLAIMQVPVIIRTMSLLCLFIVITLSFLGHFIPISLPFHCIFIAISLQCHGHFILLSFRCHFITI